MKLKGAKQQTVFLTGINAAVRAIGLCMRVWLSRTLGSEIIGIMELAQSIHMVAIAPLTSGLSAAISRLTARSDQQDRTAALLSGLWLSRLVSFFLIPGIWLASPAISRFLGDARVLPSLLFTAPCILILCCSASYNGFCYGIQRSELPALSELIEQLGRFALTFCFIKWTTRLTAPWLAAVPTAATMLAEILGLVFIMRQLPPLPAHEKVRHVYTKAVFNLMTPAALSRLVQTLLRSATAIVIPLRLQASGLSAQEATARLGLLNGMVGPMLMMPGIFTSALNMVLIPKIARAEEKPSELGRLFKTGFCCTIPISLVCGMLIYLFAPLLGTVVYRQAELNELFRKCALQAVLFPIIHLTGSALSALGLQQRSMYISCVSALVSLALTWNYAGNPALRLNGVIRAQYISQLFTTVSNIAVLCIWRKRQPVTTGDKCV